MREVISLHVGQAGVQIGNACCKETYLLYPFSILIVYLVANRGTLHTRARTERAYLTIRHVFRLV